MAKPVTNEISARGSIRITAFATARTFGPLADSHPCYALVGLIAAEQARVEHMLDVIIWDLAKVEQQVGACITSQLSGMYGRYAAIFQLADYRGLPDAIHKEISSQSGKSGSLAEDRNRAIHDPWYEDTASGGSFQMKGRAKRNPLFGVHPVTEDDLRKILSSFRSFSERVIKLRNDIWAITHP